MTADVRGLAVQAVALAVLSSRVRDRLDDVKAELAEALDPGDRKTAALDSGQKVGSISFSNGRAQARVTDERALREWVREHAPDEIIEQIRPSYLSVLLDIVKNSGEPVMPSTGEVIPGVEYRPGTPYLSVKPLPDGIPALTDAIRAGQLLALDGIPDPPEYDHDADFEPVHDGEAV